MKITFGMIVFNAELNLPDGMLEACIKNVYDIAHEIIIVEGATKAITHYFDGDTSQFTSDGHSMDRTIQIIKGIPDPDKKITLIESSGFWNGKTQMCNEWAKLATGDYIWQLDSDEFYHTEEMKKMINYLELEKPDAVYFNAYHFFGGLDYCIDERSAPQNTGWGSGPWYRLFRHVPGKSKWLSHEHPIYECDGLVCNDGKLVDQKRSAEIGIKMYHYSYIDYRQIDFKTKFYKNDIYPKTWNLFLKDKNYKPLGSQAFKFDGEHPDIIKKLFNIK
jgi:glycosyltransferase involved in cell wall biosynthesis